MYKSLARWANYVELIHRMSSKKQHFFQFPVAHVWNRFSLDVVSATKVSEIFFKNVDFYAIADLRHWPKAFYLFIPSYFFALLCVFISFINKATSKLQKTQIVPTLWQWHFWYICICLVLLSANLLIHRLRFRHLFTICLFTENWGMLRGKGLFLFFLLISPIKAKKLSRMRRFYFCFLTIYVQISSILKNYFYYSWKYIYRSIYQ